MTCVYRAIRDAVLPLQHPVMGHDGRLIQNIVIPKGTALLVDYAACNTNQQIWGKDAREWKPERWLGKSLPRTVIETQFPGVYSHL